MLKLQRNKTISTYVYCENFEDENKRKKSYFITSSSDPEDLEKDKMRLLRPYSEKCKDLLRFKLYIILYIIVIMATSIPKIAFTFWEGIQFTYMHALTIETFHKFNPDFKIIIYTTNVNSSDSILVNWNSGEQTKKYNNLYDINELKKIDAVEFVEIDVNKLLDYHGILSCVWKSDIIRILKLYEHGGVYIDFDILFINKIPNSIMNIKEKVMFNTYYGIINNAVIICEKENYIVKIILDSILEKLKTQNVTNEYEQFGPNLVTRIVKNSHLEKDVYYIPNDMTCPYLYNEMDKLFLSNINQITENTFAIHWYNGDSTSRNYCSNFDINKINKERCIFEKILYEININEKN